MQVCIALGVGKGGMPLGYQIFAGDRNDVTTVEEIVEYIEGQYGVADRIWVMDRGMVSEENVTFLREGGRRHILGRPRAACAALSSRCWKGTGRRCERGWK
jgi:transposase